MNQRSVTIATRKSALALAQARAFVRQLEAIHPAVEFRELLVTTTGDRVQDRLLSEIGGKGLFVKEIEEALLDGRADFAVHSLKDVPPDLPAGLTLSCIPEREDARDVLISRAGQPLAALPLGSSIGTSSLRRRVQLALARPDLRFLMLRGNVDTRIRKCREGEVDAIVLARAGLVRLDLADQATEVLAPELSLPAVGQGALAIEQRADDDRISALLAPLAHHETKIAVTIERAALRAIEGSCQTPVAVYALRQAAGLWLRGLLTEPDGSNLRRAELRVPWPQSTTAAEALGLELGRRLRVAS